jgi:polyisoprenoid-binding protein YceI
MSRLSLVLVSALVLGAAACEDPAKNVSSATVDSAKPVQRPSAASSAKPAGSAAATATATATAASTAAPAGAPEKPANALTLDGATSKVGFIGSKVTGKHEGNFEKLDGWIAIDGDKAEAARIYVEIDMGSVKTDSADLDKHLKSDDFFAIEKNPKGVFESTSIKAGGEKGATHTIEGNLKLRGVEKSVTFPATVKISADEITAKAEFSINRKNWDIKYEGKKDDLIRDDVVIKLDLKVARKK